MEAALWVIIAVLTAVLIAVNIISANKMKNYANEMNAYADKQKRTLGELYDKAERCGVLFELILNAIEIANKYKDNFIELSEYEFDRVFRKHEGKGAIKTTGEFQSDRDLLLDMFQTASVYDGRDYWPTGVYYFFNTHDTETQAAVCWLEEEPETAHLSISEEEDYYTVLRYTIKFIHISGNLYVAYETHEAN